MKRKRYQASINVENKYLLQLNMFFFLFLKTIAPKTKECKEIDYAKVFGWD